MRVRMTYSTPPVPCDDATYGEVEDYTIVTGPPAPWLSANPLSGTLNYGESITIAVGFDSYGLPAGDYSGTLVFTCSDPYHPVVNIDVLLHVTSPFFPQIAVDPSFFSFEIHPGGTERDILTVENMGTDTLFYNMDIEYIQDHPKIVGTRPEADPANCEAAGGSFPGKMVYSDDPYNLQFEFACGDASGEAGTECDGNYIYTTKWNGTGNFFRYELDGTFIGQFYIAGTAGVRDLAYDGVYMYGAAANTSLFEMDFNDELLVNTLSAPVATRAIAYDEGENGFWANNWSNNPVLFDRSGTVIKSFEINGDESFYGFAYMDNDEGLALWGNSQSGNGNTLKRYSLPEGTWESDFDMTSILTMPVPGTDIAGGLYMSPDICTGRWTLGGLVQNICLWGVEMGTVPTTPSDWLEVEPMMGSLAPGASKEHDIIAYSGNFIWYEFHEAMIVISSNDPVTPELQIPVFIGIINDLDDGTTQYFMMYPNPTSNGFTIKSDNDFNTVKVFNQSGRLILEREVHSREINISSNMPIGIYFVEITSDYGQATQKLIVQ